jgi:hypothetical protein
MTCGIAHLSLHIIAGVRHGQQETLEVAEGHWISRPGTLQCQGGIDERKKFKLSIVKPIFCKLDLTLLSFVFPPMRAKAWPE